MKKLFSTLALAAALVTAEGASAQLPANPWEISPNDGTFDNVDYATSTEDAVTQAPMYGNGPTDGEVLPVDPWAKARDKSGIETWRGSGQHGRLNYVGEATTFGEPPQYAGRFGTLEKTGLQNSGKLRRKDQKSAEYLSPHPA